MGLGFYGRAFQLADPACNKPGCVFNGGATKGAYSGESGILSYREIMEIIRTKKLKPVHDKEAGVKYITWNTDQWVSYDDKETFKQKKDLAKELGLGGFLIWAIDQDDDQLSALSAVLDPKPLGDFRSDKADENWTGSNEMCYISKGGDGCNPGDIKITQQNCVKGKDSKLCCPLSGAPDPKECTWRGGPHLCNGHCHDDEVMTHMSKWGGGADCWDGNAAHCCKSPLGEENTCYWGGVAQECKAGHLPLTFSGTVLSILDDIAEVILLVVGRAVPLVSLTDRLLLEVLDQLDLDTNKLYCSPEKDVERWKNCAWFKREIMHRHDDTLTAKLIDETWSCSKADVSYEGHLLAQALLKIKVESSFGFTLIVSKLNLPLDLSQSYFTFYNKGEITGVMTLEAVAKVFYEKKSVILNIPFPGASFKIPGIATIGLQLTVEGSIDASLAVAGTIETKLEIAKWEVRQVVPDNNDDAYMPKEIGEGDTSLDRTGDFEGIKKPEFYAGVAVQGDVTARLSAAAEFGIRFDDRCLPQPGCDANIATAGDYLSTMPAWQWAF